MKNIRENLEKIDYAILTMIEKHPSWNLEDILLRVIREEETLSFEITREELISEIAKQALKVAISDNRFGHLPGKNNCINFLEKLKKESVSFDKIIQYLEKNPIILKEITISFSKIRYKNRKNIDLKGLDLYSNSYIREYLYHLNDTKRLLSKIKELKIYDGNVNKCREDICKGIQLQKEKVDYSLGTTLFASTNIGKERKKQEDSVLLLRHPKNKHFKMLSVADGIGGFDEGGEASKYTMQSIIYWFEDLNEKYYENPTALAELLIKKLKEINEQINAFEDGRGTTFVGAIVGRDKTLIASVGDSRAYITKDNELIQVSRDDSLVQKYYEKGIIRTKDDMRFHYASNRITQFLGMLTMYTTLEPNIYFLNNSDYDNLILVSDGISDCLSDSQIIAITKKTPREDIAKALVEGAIKNTSHRKNSYNKKEFTNAIPAGKDNTTAAVYTKLK